MCPKFKIMGARAQVQKMRIPARAQVEKNEKEDVIAGSNREVDRR